MIFSIFAFTMNSNNNNTNSNRIDVIMIVPSEIWLKIFDQLNYKDVKTSLEVCKTWNSIIAGSGRFITKTRLIIRIYSDSEFISTAASFKIDRCYDSLKIISFTNHISPQDYRMFLVQLNKTAYRLRNVSFHRCKFFAADFVLFLQQCTQLDKLELQNNVFWLNYDVIPSVEMNLQEFKFQGSKGIMDFLDCRRVTQELVLTGEDLKRDKSEDEIVRFLNKIEGNVGKLEVEEIDLDQSCVTLRPKFKWHSLKLKADKVETMFNSKMENKQRLYDSSSEVASRLQFIFACGHRAIYDIIAKTKLVRILTISENMFMDVPMPYESLPNLDHIKELIIIDLSSVFMAADHDEFSPYFEQFMNKLVNLESLQMNPIFARHFSNDSGIIRSFLRKLKTLELKFSYGFFTEDDDYIHTYTHPQDIAVERLSHFNWPEVQTLIMHVHKSVFASLRRFTQIASMLSQNSPELREVKLNVSDIISKHELQKIALSVFVAMPNVAQFEFRSEHTRSTLEYRATRDEILAKYFGEGANDAKVRSSIVVLMHLDQHR